MRAKVRIGWAGALALLLALGGACGGKKVAVTNEDVNQALAAAQAAYQKLLDLNPPQTLEYQSRVMLKQAEDALANKHYADAKATAEQAQQQAEMAYQARSQMIEDTKKRLEKTKAELELLYFPRLDLIAKYWETVDDLKQKKFDQAKALADSLEPNVAKEKQLNVSSTREVNVWAPDDDVRRFGWPRVYESVLSNCTLSNVVDTVEVGKRVSYIRLFLCSPQRTFYFIENPKTGKQGWMAERYLSTSRAERH